MRWLYCDVTRKTNLVVWFEVVGLLIFVRLASWKSLLSVIVFKKTARKKKTVRAWLTCIGALALTEGPFDLSWVSHQLEGTWYLQLLSLLHYTYTSYYCWKGFVHTVLFCEVDWVVHSPLSVTCLCIFMQCFALLNISAFWPILTLMH